MTPEGYIKSRCIVTRCGVFLYKNADGTVRKELRHPDDVNIPESLDSMKMIPIVNGHPPERLVNADNAKRLSVGYTGEIVENNYPYIISNLIVTDKNAVNDIKEKRKNELSLGYTVDLIPEEGNYFGEPYEFRQTNIRYNHLALVDQARAGPEAKIVLDGNDAEEILKEEAVVANNKTRKVKIDAEEYMLEDNAASAMEKMSKDNSDLKARHEALMDAHEKMKGEHAHMKDMLEKAHAERDSMRDKDHHDPEAVHHPMEEDEIGSEGKEEHDPSDSMGMSSHVKDYEKPSNLENHTVESPKNKHYPHDLPHISKVDAAEVNRRVNDRVKLVRLSERYLDKNTLARLDSLSDTDIKRKLIKTLQPKANLEGKSEVYINARFDSVIDDAPAAKVIANPASRVDMSEDAIEKESANAVDSRKAMIKRQKLAYKGGK
jgi:hypothetical protein